MATTFVPPRPDQWEGPAQSGFTPPPVSSWEGPAQQSASGPASDSDVQQIMREHPGLSRHGAQEALRQGLLKPSGAKPESSNPLWEATKGAFGAARDMVVGGAKTAAHGFAAGMETNPMGPAHQALNQDIGSAVNAHVDQGKKAADAWKRGEHVEAVGHGMAAALPVVGPAAAGVGETAGGQLEYDDQGHAVSEIRKPNPARAVGEGAVLIASASPRNVVGPASRYVAPKVAGAVATVADRLGVPEALERSAGTSYRKMLTPTAKGVVKEAESIAGGPSENGPTGLVRERPVAVTRKGMMDQMQGRMNEVGPKTSTIYDDKAPLPAQPILDHLEGIRRQKAVVKGSNVVADPGLNSAIDELKETVEALRDENGDVPAQALDDFKDKLNKGNVNPKGHMRQLAPQTASAIEGSVAGRIKGYLDTAYPDAARVNAAYRTAKGTHNFLEEQRTAEIAAQSGVRTGSSSGFGAALKKMIPAPLRSLPNAISSLTDSVAWDSVSGATKAKVAEMIRNGSWDTAAEAMKPLPKLLTQGDKITPPPADTSSVRAVPGMAQPPNPRRAIGPGRGTIVLPYEPPQPEISVTTGEPLRVPPSRQLPAGSSPSSRTPVTVDALGSRSGDVTDFVPSINPQTGQVEYIPRQQRPAPPLRVPRFAKGGIIRKPTIGLVGEAGPEAIVPVESLTAAHATVPENPDAIGEQLNQLASLKRRVVMLPKGTFPHSAPEGMAHYADQLGNRYIFNPSLISKNDIRVAVLRNRLPDILGAKNGGMGVPDKSALRGNVVNVVGMSKRGSVVQSTASDVPHMKSAIRQTKRIAPKVRIENPSREINRRLKALA